MATSASSTQSQNTDHKVMCSSLQGLFCCCCHYLTSVTGYESEPRSAVYINTSKGKALCTFLKLQTAVNHSVYEAGQLMDQLGLPKFGPEQLEDVEDFDMTTPGAGLMTLNAKFWGRDPEAAKVEFMKKFDTVKKVKGAVQVGKAVCLKVLSGVVNHIAPAGTNRFCYMSTELSCYHYKRIHIHTGQRMPELQSITLLEQQVPVSHVVLNLFTLIMFNRTASGACCASMRQELVLFRITGRTQVIAPRI